VSSPKRRVAAGPVAAGSVTALTVAGVDGCDHTARLTRLESGQAKVLAGVQVIIGLLDGQDNLPD